MKQISFKSTWMLDLFKLSIAYYHWLASPVFLTALKLEEGFSYLV